MPSTCHRLPFLLWTGILLCAVLRPALTLGQSCVPAPVGLSNWWTGDNGGTDELGGNTAAFYNNVTIGSGQAGNAFVLTGGGHLRAAESGSLHFTTMTVEAWVFPTTHGNYHEMVSKWNGSFGSGASYDFALHPDGRAYFLLTSDGTSATAFAITTNSLPLSMWTHLVGTYDGNTIRIYMNGTMQNQVSYTGGIYQGTADLGIGGTVGGLSAGQAANPFEGSLDEVSLYNRALSNTEIQSLYNAGAWGKCQNLAPYIATQPTNVTAIVGTPASFFSIVGGRPATYQWYFNNVPIAGATSNWLTFQSVQFSNAGSYYLVASNSTGFDTSQAAQLTVSPAPPCDPVPSGLVSWWPGENSADDALALNSGVLLNGATFVNGMVGRGFKLDGSSAHVRVTDRPSLRCTNGLTLEAWIYPVATNSPQGLIVKWGAVSGLPASQDCYGMSLEPDGRVYLLVSSNGLAGGGVQVDSFSAAQPGRWTHVAATYDGAAMRIYFNGTLENQVAFSGGIFPGTNDLGIGAVVGGAASGQQVGHFNGRIDEPSLYNRALSDSEILAIYNASVSGKCAIAPSVTAQPTGFRVKPGTNVTFSVTARGTPLSFQWRLNGFPVSGATNKTLTLTNVQPHMAGNYSVGVTNSLGGDLSQNALLKVDVLFALGNGLLLTNSSTNLSGPVTLQITNVYSGGDIFYTLDGSQPTFFSAFYSGPIVVNQSVILRALGYSADFFEYGELDPIAISIVPAFSLSASTPGGGSISLSPSGGTYLSNTTVTATATPASGWTFLQWTGDASGTTNSVAVKMDKAKSIQAVFGTTLTASAAGGGSVLLNPPAAVYPYGSAVSVCAVPSNGNFFVLWGNAASGSVNPLTYTVTSANRSISSLFSSVPAGQAALAIVPIGRGHVTFSPHTNLYNFGTVLSVTASADAGQSFVNWSGDAGGTQNPLTVTMNQNRTIYANFTHGAVLTSPTTAQGLRSNGFALALTGDYGTTYELYVSSNLSTWSALTTLTNLVGTVQYLDSTATNAPRRFYRAMLLP